MPRSGADPTQIAPRTERWLPHALVATAFVVLFPALVVWMIVPRGEPALLALSVPLGMLLSVLAAAVGTALWKRVPGSRDLVFADLMLWGWLRRLSAERRLRRAETLLGTHADGLSVQALTDLSALLEARDSFTYGHSLRVTRHAERIASELGLSQVEVAQVRTAAALHDVGKLHTPREILNKPGRLTDEEFAVIRRHPGDGADMSISVGDPTITAMIRHHHERLDGAGYPAGLGGEAIPLGARIIAVADTFDAMTSNRAYRRAASHKRALDVLREESGKQLDADAVAAFVGYYRGRRTVVWSAFATAAPQRLFAWLGGLTPGVSAGVAGAAAVAIGVASPHPPVESPAAAAVPHRASKRAEARAPDRPRPVLGDSPTAPGSTRRAASQGSPPARTKRRARKQAQRKANRPPRVKAKQLRPAPAPHAAKPQKVKPQKLTPAKPVKPDKVKPAKPAKPDTVKPAKPEKVKPQTVAPPAAKPPKVKSPKAAPVVVPTPAAPPPIDAPKVKKPKQ